MSALAASSSSSSSSSGGGDPSLSRSRDRDALGAPIHATRDSITDIYGARTPYYGEGQWPVRVDSAVLRDEEVSQWVASACLLCSNGCGCEIGVSARGRMVGVRGRADDRVNRGRMGPKGLHCFQVNHNRERLTQPLVRGKDGRLHPASWDEAMALVVRRAQQLRAHATSHSIGFYTSGQLFLEEYYVLAMIGKAGLHTLHMDGNTRLCTATAAAAMRESFGSDGQPGSYEDIDCAHCIFLVGHNMANTQTVLWTRLLDRLAGPTPPSLIVLDPRVTTTASHATVHLANRSGTNLAVLNGLAHLLVKNGHVKRDFVDPHTIGFEGLEKLVEKYTPEAVEAWSGVPAEKLRAAAQLLGNAPSVLSTVLQGVYQSHQATASACAVNNLHLLLGQIGIPGGGILQMNGQPTAQNNREAGCNGEFPAFRNYQNEKHMQELAAVWKVEEHALASYHAPTHIMAMLEYIKEGSIKMLWVSGTNPAVTLPDLASTRELLSKPDLFLVVQDCFLTETAELASVVLPAAIWGEKRGCFTNVDRTVHFSEKAIEPPGEARSDFDIFVDFARRMHFKNKHGDELIPFRTPEEAFKSWQECSRGRVCDYTGLSYERLKREGGIQWPCNEAHPQGTQRLFADRHFLTSIDEAESWGHDLDTGCPLQKKEYANLNPRGRAIFKFAHFRPPPDAPTSDYPFALLTGRSVFHFHTRTKTARIAALQRAEPDAWVELHEDDAKQLGISEGDLVRVASSQGSVEVAARIAPIARGQVFVPMHYGSWDRRDLAEQGVVRSGRALTGGGARRSTAPNELTAKYWDPVSKQPLLKHASVKLTRLASAEEAAAQVQLHDHQSSGKKKPLASLLCCAATPGERKSDMEGSPPPPPHPQTKTVEEQARRFADAGGAEAISSPDTSAQRQYLPYELRRGVVHAALLDDTFGRLHAKYAPKGKLELSAELAVMREIAGLVLKELRQQEKRFPLHTGEEAAAGEKGSEGGVRDLTGGGEGGATLAAAADHPAADTSDLHSLRDLLFPSDEQLKTIGSPSVALLRELHGLHTFAASLQSQLTVLHLAGAAVHDNPLKQAMQFCVSQTQRCLDWPMGQAKAKSWQALIVPA